MRTKEIAEKEDGSASNDWEVAARLMGVDAPGHVLARVGNMVWKRAVEKGQPIIRIGSSSPRWTIKRNKAGVRRCNCPDWKYRRQYQNGTCKHLTFLELNGITVDEKAGKDAEA